MAWPVEMADEDFMRRRRGRNIAMLLTLAAVSLLFYAVAMVKFASQTPHGH
jgi:hypothetical protein